jgi:hypothetical protein
MIADLEMKIGSLSFNGAAQKIVDAQSHDFTRLREENAASNVASGGLASKDAGME